MKQNTILTNIVLEIIDSANDFYLKEKWSKDDKDLIESIKIEIIESPIDVGDDTHYEIPRSLTKSGNPEVIHVDLSDYWEVEEEDLLSQSNDFSV